MDTNRITYAVIYVLLINGRFLCFGTTELQGIKNRSVEAMLARPGDINIGVVLYMTDYDSESHQCGPVPIPFECSQMAMTIYVTDLINRRTDLLPNITLGFVMVDGCSNDMRSLEMATFFINDDDDSCSDSNDIVLDSNRLSDELMHYWVIGITGLSLSRVSTAVSPLMGIYQVPMISTYATSDELSDKSRYEYFTRLVATDRYQALAILGVCRYFGWSYVSIVYTEGSYGENGIKQIEDLLHGEASSYGICIAVAIKISSQVDKQEYNTISDTLIENENARIVIMFVETAAIMQPLLSAIGRKRDIGTFVWFGLDGMDELNEQPVTENDMLEGTFYVTHPFVEMPDFEDFLRTFTPATSQDNPWVLESWENEYKCKFSDINKPCNMNLTLDSTTCLVIPSKYNRVHDAFLIFASVLHDHISDTCPMGFLDKRLLKDCIHGDVLLQRIRTSTFDGVLGRIQFNEDGDFMENLNLRQFYSTEDRIRRSKIVGLWNSTDQQLSINESQIEWELFNKRSPLADMRKPPLSVCSKPCLDNQYVVKQSLVCCWICGDCRNNEIILQNRTGCQSCPMLTWPDEDTTTVCIPIAPVYLHYSDILSILLLCLTVVVGLCSIICIGVFVAQRKTKLVRATSIQLSLFILVGTLFVCATVVVFVVPPNTANWICIARYVGFHFGISMIYTPLLVKNIRIYRIFAFGKKSVRPPRCITSEFQMIFVVILLTIQV